MQFQFQDGAVKRQSPTQLVLPRFGFQFQDGAVKSINFVYDELMRIRFQFQDGAVKSWLHHRERLSLYSISIPRWCG